MNKILVIANLKHASPRIPSIFGNLGKDWKVTFLNYELDALETLEEIYSNQNYDIEVAPCKGDIFWWIRRYLFRGKLPEKNSYSETLKSKIPVKKFNVVNFLMKSYLSIFGIPDSNIPCLSSLIQKARMLVDSHEFDIVYSSSPYPIVHFVASNIKKDCPDIKWIAEFRDLWVLNHNYPFGSLRKSIDGYLEKKVLKKADGLVTISEPLADAMRHFHHKSIEMIPNGFSPSNQLGIFKSKKRMIISYTGVIYEGKQDPEKILVALSELIKENVIDEEKIVLNFYGRYNDRLSTLIEQYSLMHCVFQCGYKTWSEIRNYQHNSDLLLLLQWEDSSELGIFPLKMYEYLDAGKTILATGGGKHNAEINDILTRTNAGVFAYDIISIKNNLTSFYEEFLRNGYCSYSGFRDEILKHSYLSIAQSMSKYLKSVI